MNRDMHLDHNKPRNVSDWIIGISLSALIHVLLWIGFIFFPQPESFTFIPINTMDLDLAALPPSIGRPNSVGGVPGVASPVPNSSETAQEEVAEQPEPEIPVVERKAVAPEKTGQNPPKEETAISFRKDKIPPRNKEDQKNGPNDEKQESEHPMNVGKNNLNPPHEKTTNSLEMFHHSEEGATIGAGGPRGNRGTEEGRRTQSGFQGTLIERYQLFVKAQISENWAFSKNRTADMKNPETWMSFEILPHGEVKNVRIVKSSGNDDMDQAATQAILKSNPVRPHPPGMNKPSMTMGIIFRPNELN